MDRMGKETVFQAMAWWRTAYKPFAKKKMMTLFTDS